MNTYKKFCPNVFVAQCEEEHQKGDVITVTTKYGKENECVVHNLVGHVETENGRMYLYSITRLDGFNSQERAKNKIDKLNTWADNASKKGKEWLDKADEGKDFLALAEPIKIGHHSEKRHRALIERNWNRMDNAMKHYKKSASYRERTAFWEDLATKIDLSMPESLEFFKIQLDEARKYHKELKDGVIEREHSYSLTYARKRVNDLTKKYATAIILWA